MTGSDSWNNQRRELMSSGSSDGYAYMKLEIGINEDGSSKSTENLNVSKQLTDQINSSDGSLSYNMCKKLVRVRFQKP